MAKVWLVFAIGCSVGPQSNRDGQANDMGSDRDAEATDVSSAADAQAADAHNNDTGSDSRECVVGALTACVHSCGESDNAEDTAAACISGSYQCATPLIAAANCPRAPGPPCASDGGFQP
jgi:hypothetical protein